MHESFELDETAIYQFTKDESLKALRILFNRESHLYYQQQIPKKKKKKIKKVNWKIGL